MTTITSDKVKVNRSAEEIFRFLLDMNNFQQLLPQDKISEFTSSEEHCSFKVQGAITIPLHRVEQTEYSHIHIRSGEKAPFPFTLDVKILVIDESNCEGHLVFNGEMNAFLRMMAERPLSNLFNFIAKRVAEIHP